MGISANYSRARARQIVRSVLGHAIPAGAHVHHVDCNPWNNEKRNLVVCSDRAYHQLLHMRAEAYDATGSASAIQCVECKLWQLDPRELLNVGNNRGIHTWCYEAFWKARAYEELPWDQ